MINQAPSRAVAWLDKQAAWHLPVILVIALALRLIYAGWAQGIVPGSEGDTVEAYEVAAKFLAGEERAQYIGQPKCNAASKLPGPLWTLFCVAGLKLSGSLGGVVLLTIAANLAAIGLTWRLAREVSGPAAANAAAFFMAISPWAVQYSSVVWNPSPLPLFGAVTFLALFRCQRRPQSRAIFFIPFLILVAAQFHLSAIALILPLIAFGWIARIKPHWGWLAAGIVGGALCYAPYIAGEMRHGWENTRGMLLGGRRGFSPTALRAFFSPLTFLANFWYPGGAYTPEEYQAFARRTFGGFAGLTAANFVSVAFIAGALWGLRRATATALRVTGSSAREILARSPGLLSVLFLLLAYLTCGLLSGKPFHSRYCLVVLPLVFVLAGCGTAECLRSARARMFFAPVVLLLAATNLWFVPAVSRFERDRIAHGSVFVPASRKLESVYQQLKSREPGLIKVRHKSYHTAPPKGEQSLNYLHSMLLSQYVRARELTLYGATSPLEPMSVFELRPARSVDPSEPSVAFYGNGIALVAVSQ